MKKEAGCPLRRALKKASRRMKILKIKFYVLILLPIGLITVGQAVLKEYRRVKKLKMREIAQETSNDLTDQDA